MCLQTIESRNLVPFFETFFYCLLEALSRQAPGCRHRQTEMSVLSPLPGYFSWQRMAHHVSKVVLEGSPRLEIKILVPILVIIKLIYSVFAKH